jgi:hypothetical protein
MDFPMDLVVLNDFHVLFKVTSNLKFYKGCLVKYGRK